MSDGMAKTNIYIYIASSRGRRHKRLCWIGEEGGTEAAVAVTTVVVVVVDAVSCLSSLPLSVLTVSLSSTALTVAEEESSGTIELPVSADLRRGVVREVPASPAPGPRGLISTLNWTEGKMYKKKGRGGMIYFGKIDTN